LASAALSAVRIAGDPQHSLKCAEEAALNFISNSSRAAQDASLRAATLIRAGATVLTHSRSSTVLSAFIEARRAARKFSVVVTESRPMLEGRAMAEALASHDISVTLIADAAASLSMDVVDLVMLGADQITPGNLVNKIGTRMIALSGRERGLQVYAICDSSKLIREDYFGAPYRRSRNADELWSDAPRGVKVVNSYFEPTPLSWFTGVVTEDGVLSIAEAAGRAEEASIDTELMSALGMPRERIK
jgi:translation initiation factor eIF-2B subunit delta